MALTMTAFGSDKAALVEAADRVGFDPTIFITILTMIFQNCPKKSGAKLRQDCWQAVDKPNSPKGLSTRLAIKSALPAGQKKPARVNAFLAEAVRSSEDRFTRVCNAARAVPVEALQEV